MHIACTVADPDGAQQPPPKEFDQLFFGIPYSLNKKEWICSLFKEWILEKSEIRVKVWSEHLQIFLNITKLCKWPEGVIRIPWVMYMVTLIVVVF